MKRAILTSALLFAAIITLSAQSIIGQWKTIVDNDGEKINVVMNFAKDGKFTLAMSQSIKSPEIGELQLLINMPGTYKMKDAKNMVVNLETNKTDVKFEIKF